MKEFIKRLVACGYSKEKARELLEELSKNLPYIEIENFVISKEKSCG